MTDVAEREQLYGRLYTRLKAGMPSEAGFQREDAAGALGTFLVAFGMALPVVLPLLIFGSGAVDAVRLGESPKGALLLLAAQTVLLLTLAPPAAAAALRIGSDNPP